MKKYVMLIFTLLSFTTMLKAQNLDDYFKEAAENNPGLQAKYKNFEAAMQRVTSVSSLPDPNLSFGYFISPVETRVGPQRARFSLTQMFPWFGTLKAQEHAATLMAEAKYQEFLDERNMLYYQVSAFYYPLFELQELISIEEENQRILSSYKDIATVKFQNGKGTMVDALRVDIMLQDASTNLSILKQKEKPLATRFNKLLNRQDNESIIVQDSQLTTKIPPAYRRDSLLISNPLLEELALKIQASKANDQAAIKQGLPKLGVGLDYVIVDQRTDMAVQDNGRDILMPMVSVSLPIFRGKYKAAQAEAQLMQESFSLQREEVSNRLTSSYDMVWFEIQKQAELIELCQNQIQVSEQSLTLLFTAYGNSGKEFEEVLRMQQQILKYQKMKATALSEYHIARAELDYITAKSK
jgi:outer membrane protein TolC